MGLEWFRNEGPINSSPNPQRFDNLNDEQFILLVRTLQYDDVAKGAYINFNSLYDVAMANNQSYINITNNHKLKQEPPNPSQY